MSRIPRDRDMSKSAFLLSNIAMIILFPIVYIFAMFGLYVVGVVIALLSTIIITILLFRFIGWYAFLVILILGLAFGLDAVIEGTTNFFERVGAFMAFLFPGLFALGLGVRMVMTGMSFSKPVNIAAYICAAAYGYAGIVAIIAAFKSTGQAPGGIGFNDYAAIFLPTVTRAIYMVLALHEVGKGRD